MPHIPIISKVEITSDQLWHYHKGVRLFCALILIWMVGFCPSILAQPVPPEPLKGHLPLTGPYSGDPSQVKTFVMGAWRTPFVFRGKVSPWVGLLHRKQVKTAPTSAKRTKKLETTPFEDLFKKPNPPSTFDFWPAISPTGGWILLRNPSPVALTPALITRWDSLYPKGSPGITVIPFGKTTAINPNQRNWEPGALMWFLVGPEEIGVAPPQALEVFPYSGFQHQPETEVGPECHHLRLATELNALQNPLGVPEADKVGPLCGALGVLRKAEVKFFGAFPPGPPSGGRNERTLTGSLVLPTGSTRETEGIKEFSPAFAPGNPAGRWVFQNPVSLFALRNSLERANLLKTPHPPASPDGSFFVWRSMDETGFTFAIHQRQGRCEEGCLIESVCLIRVLGERIAARAGICE